MAITYSARTAEQVMKELDEVKAKYNELLYAVGKKYLNESRHETALRYIQEAEMQDFFEAGVEEIPINDLKDK